MINKNKPTFSGEKNNINNDLAKLIKQKSSNSNEQVKIIKKY